MPTRDLHLEESNRIPETETHQPNSNRFCTKVTEQFGKAMCHFTWTQTTTAGCGMHLFLEKKWMTPSPSLPALPSYYNPV